MVQKKAGDTIIVEGDDGDNLYLVDSGVLSCTKVIKGQVTNLKEY